MDVAKWRLAVDNAISYQQKEVGTYREQTLELLKGEFFGAPFRKENNLSEFNFLYLYLKTKVGGLYARDPHIFVRGNTPKRSSFAYCMETVLNYYWRELKVKQKMKRVIGEAVLVPPGWSFTGIQAQEDPRFDLMGNEIPEETTEAEEGNLDDTVKRGDLFFRHIPSWRVVWPEGYNDRSACPWMCMIEPVAITDVKNNPMYGQKFKDNLRGDKKTSERKAPKLMKFKSTLPVSKESSDIEDEEIVHLYHIWDKRTSKRFTICDRSDEVGYEDDWHNITERFPLYDLALTELPELEDDDNSYPLSDVVPMLPQLRDLSVLNAAMIKHGKRAGACIVTRKGSLTEDDRARLAESDSVEIIELESIDASDLATFTMPQVPSDWYKLADRILDSLMMITGFQQLLGHNAGVDSATESNNLMASAQLRQSSDADTIEDYTVDVARGMAALLWQSKSRQEIEEIMGEPVTDEMWPTLPENIYEARRIIHRELNFRIDAGSTRPPKDEAVELKLMVDLVNMIQAAFPGRLNEPEAVKQLIKRGKFQDVENLVRTDDDEEIQVATQENQLMSQGMMQMASPNENHIIHLQIHGQAANPLIDAHIQQHAKYYNQRMPKANPQRGDTKSPAGNVIPSAARGGVTEFADMLASTQNVQQGVNA